jgi:hypothetical protein
VQQHGISKASRGSLKLWPPQKIRKPIVWLIVGVILTAIAAVAISWCYPNRDTRVDEVRATSNPVVEHDPIEYAVFSKLIDEAVESKDWARPEKRLLKKEVTWHAVVVSSDKPSYIIQPDLADPRYTQVRAHVTLENPDDYLPLVKGEHVEVTGIVCGVGKKQIDIMGATVIVKR